MSTASAMRKGLEGGAEEDEWEEGKERCAVARESLLIHLSRRNNIAFSARTRIVSFALRDVPIYITFRNAYWTLDGIDEYSCSSTLEV